MSAALINRRAVFVAGLITASAMSLSILAIIVFLRGEISRSIGLSLLAFLLDTLDGWVARRWRGESSFGRNLDSVTDIILYLIYPAIVMYHGFGLTQWISVLVLIVFFGAGIFRLLRFGRKGYVQTSSGQPAYPGLPVVFSLALIVLFRVALIKIGTMFVPIANSLLLLMSVFMVMKFPFPKPRQPWALVIVLVAVSVYFFIQV